jgi:3',5'-cyclic AMP phosphodiesterase CpdA
MTKEEIKSLLGGVEKIFAEETNLIRLESGRVVFVGDTHGDFEATSKVIETYLKPGNKLVFLGDYVDRGPASLENINFLLEQKLEHPDSIFLLMGNHEGYGVVPFSPANFWEGLDVELRQRYSAVLSKLPLAAFTTNGVIALHGALPDVPGLRDIDEIKLGDDKWHQITWGDWQEREGGFLGFDPYTGRPQFGQSWFEEIMSRFGRNILIRSHQPNAAKVMYGGRCLTIFTSSAYKHYVPERTVAVLDSDKEVHSVADVKIEVV